MVAEPKPPTKAEKKRLKKEQKLAIGRQSWKQDGVVVAAKKFLDGRNAKFAPPPSEDCPTCLARRDKALARKSAA